MSNEVLVNAVADNNGTLRLFTRTGAFEIDFPDAFYLTPADAEKLPSEWTDLVSEPDRGFCRVTWPDPVRPNGSRPGRLKYFHENLFKPLGIEVLEADVDPAQRFLIEHPKVELATDWRLLWYDLETEPIDDWGKPWRSRILSFSWRSSTGRSGHERLEARTDAAERVLVRKFAALADRHDVLLAWNGSRFDDKLVTGRMTLLDIPFDRELYHWLDPLWLFKRYFQRSEDGAVTQSYALERVAEALLGTERKLPIRDIAYERGWRNDSGNLFLWVWENDPALLREYNDQDVELMIKLEAKTGFIALHLGLCRLCRNLPTRGSQYPMTQVDGRMLMQGWAAGYHFRSRIRTDEEDFQKRARGAYVPEAVIGLHESVAIVDYSRMYPSIIRTFNMSPETLAPGGSLRVPETTPHGRLTQEVLARFRAKPEGHLPAALRGVLEERLQYEARMDAAEVGSDEWYDAQRLSQALKIVANTFYGVILSPVSRFYVQEIGESVTSVGRHLLAQTLECAERRGHRFIMGDTDSVGVIANDEEAQGFVDEMNDEVIPRLMAACGVEDYSIGLGYEKRFDRILVTASKKYAGTFARYKGREVTDKDSPIDVRGMEIVRSDVCVAARKIQKAVLELLLRGDGISADEMWDWTGLAKDAFLDGASTVEDLVLRRAITKQIKDYVTKPVQAKVAEQMAARGMEVWTGSKIQFLMTKNGPIIPDDLGDPSELDLGLLWNQYVYAPTLRCLLAAFPDYQWDGFKVPRGYDPNQLDMFEGGRPKVRRGVDPAKANGKTKRIRKVRKTELGPRLILKVDGNWERAAQLKEVLADYPGEVPVRFEVGVDRFVVEMSSTLTIRCPDDAPQLSRALSKLGVRWAMAGR